MKLWKWGIGSVIGLFVGILLLSLSPSVSAQSASGFGLQVTPSPLVATVKPGETTELELKIRNTGTDPETLKIAPRSFSVDTGDGSVKLGDSDPTEVDGWVTFSHPTFTVEPGQWFTQKVRIAVPKDAGFSYSFALLINRAASPQPTQGGRLIEGSVAVFTLINVDRPGSVRKIDIAEFNSSQTVYEYLPAEINVRLKNTGNTIVQPYGNIFIQRGSSDETPITTLPVNETKGYILPGKERTLTTKWSDGFPVYKVAVDAKGVENRSLDWNFENIVNFRIGQYTAKLVAVYNDGERDVPLETEVTFWVIPWKTILIIIAVIIGLVLLNRKINQRRTQKVVKKALAAQAAELKNADAKKEQK